MYYMRIQILGTAAAEGWPGLFCNCPTCNKARKLGGKNFRTRNSAQIDDFYKIDLPPDTLCQCMQFGVDLSALKYLFFTHSHGDHLEKSQIEYLRPGFAHNFKNPPLQIYAPPGVYKKIAPMIQQYSLPIELRDAKPFVPIRADHLTFTPIVGSHVSTELCLNYIIQSGTATVLYTPDSGIYPKETFDFISKLKFDALIVECTFGPKGHNPDCHMNFDAVVELRDQLRKVGAAKPDTRCIITHFSHNAGVLHEEFEEIARPHGIEVAYDGMVVDVGC